MGIIVVGLLRKQLSLQQIVGNERGGVKAGVNGLLMKIGCSNITVWYCVYLSVATSLKYCVYLSVATSLKYCMYLSVATSLYGIVVATSLKYCVYLSVATSLKYCVYLSVATSLSNTIPVCTKSNDGPIYYEGDSVTLTCTMGFHGNQKPKLDWTLPRWHVDYDHLRFKQENSANLVSSSVTLGLQHMIDGKLFTCSASFVNISSTYNCTTMFKPESVQYVPYISHLRTFPWTEEHNHQTEEGSNITLACEAHGNPRPNWTWKFFPKKVNKSKVLPCKFVTCRLSYLTTMDTGSYQCIVSNTVKGVDRSATQTLYLKVNGRGVTSTAAPVSVEYKKDKGFSPYAIGAIVCASLAVILIIVFILLALKMRRREHMLHERLTRMHDENLDDQEVELLDENIQPDNSELPAEYGRLKQQWEIARKDIRLVDLIAKGSFVEVWRGRMRKYPRRNEIMKVAIKRIVSEATEKERRFYLAELEVMKAIQPHPNVLPLIGCYTGSDPWLMMVEYAVEGSLYQYLQHRRPGDLRVEISTDNHNSVSVRNQNLTAHKLLSLAAQVVNGLVHINRFKMIFYRLRASSVLVCKGGVCKLSGFGFTQDVTERNLYEANSSPVRWMSPESLFENVFNVKTDIWSFGILLWEIVHFGHLPYPDMGPHEVTEKIQTGYRMSQPPHCSSDIYNLMLMCWAENPENRPCFGDIMQNLHHLSQHADTHINIDKLPEGLRSADIIDNMDIVA
ncbi:fibroblast growth factor receptor-like [Mercenaria mercenaria]|uniref:fibroblast growth factor receptor-like n=1 Tax=Mercenaria mercenaria TaxID=6596 RepID=UPI00234F0BBC|nr:fibroblast growth factor receptor-like [Mercenaria mercenaria]